MQRSEVFEGVGVLMSWQSPKLWLNFIHVEMDWIGKLILKECLEVESKSWHWLGRRMQKQIVLIPMWGGADSQQTQVQKNMSYCYIYLMVHVIKITFFNQNIIVKKILSSFPSKIVGISLPLISKMKYFQSQSWLVAPGQGVRVQKGGRVELNLYIRSGNVFSIRFNFLLLISYKCQKNPELCYQVWWHNHCLNSRSCRWGSSLWGSAE